MNVFFKAIRLIRSDLTLLKYKIRYGRNFSFCFSDRVSPSLRIRLDDGGSLVLGENVNIRDNVIINCTGGTIVLNNRVFLNDMVCLNSRASISIGSDTVIGQGTKMYDHDHDYRHNMQNEFVCSPVKIDHNVWIGSDVIVLKGSFVGDNAVLGAASLVKGEVKPYQVYLNERTTKYIDYQKENVESDT